MTRLSYEQLNLIKDKMGVKDLWSFSKVSTFDTCSWLFKLKYIDKIRVKGDNCWTWWGTQSHDLVQGLYEGKHTYDEMIQKFEEKLLEYNLIDDPKLKFPDEGQFTSYIENLRHYFQNVRQLPYNVVNEKPVLAVFQGLEKYVFQGYLDSEFIDDEGNLVILDYKTSSMSGFTGAKLLEKSRQLMIYALGVTQHGRLVDGEMKKIPIEMIKIRYDMQKYCSISFTLKNGNLNETKAERRAWVAKIANQLRKDLEGVAKELEKLDKEATKLAKKMSMKKTTPEEAEGYSVAIGDIEFQATALSEHLYDIIQINEMIEEAINNNNLDNMPPFVQEKYTVSDCYIDVELTQEILDEFKAELISSLDKIIAKKSEEDKDEAFTRGKIEQGDSFYCVNLCDMKDHCKFYQEYKEHQAMFYTKDNAPSDEELLAMLGL